MDWQQRTDGRQRIAIYSNRPPKDFKGGAVKVIADLSVDLWVGPSDKPVPDKEWEKMSDAEKHKLDGPKILPFNGKNIKVYTFPISQSMYDAHYVMMANELIWPIFHSADANALINPLSVAKPDPKYKQSYNYQYRDPKTEELRDPDKDYKLYKELNELGNQAIARLKQSGEIGRQDIVWVHDYQCANAQGDIYTFHIPFPALETLQKATVNDKPILDGEYFQDLIREMANHPTMTFHRAIDMRNFIEVVEAIDPRFKTLNPHAYGGDGQLKHFEIEEHIPLCLFGKRVKIMNIPIDVIQDEALQAAQESKLDLTTFDEEILKEMNLPYNALHINDSKVPIKDVLGNLLDTNEEHRIFLSVHRNDYSKCSLEKMYAAANYLARHPEEKRKTHFVFFLQPTREGVPAEERYQKEVVKLAKGLRETWENSILLVPQGIEWKDFLGLLRHPNTLAYLGTGRKDGHDIMLREAASARSDYPPGDLRAALAIVTTNGTGASDVLKGTKEHPGAFIIDTNDTNFAKLHEELTKEFEEIVKISKDPARKRELVDRYHVQATESRKYDPHHFKREILKVAAQDRARSSVH